MQNKKKFIINLSILIVIGCIVLVNNQIVKNDNPALRNLSSEDSMNIVKSILKIKEPEISIKQNENVKNLAFLLIHKMNLQTKSFIHYAMMTPTDDDFKDLDSEYGCSYLCEIENEVDMLRRIEVLSNENQLQLFKHSHIEKIKNDFRGKNYSKNDLLKLLFLIQNEILAIQKQFINDNFLSNENK